MPQCDHEEADTRIIVHVKDSLERGSNSVMVRTVDTDVVALLIGHFYDLCEHNPSADVWVGFGTGKQFRYYHINTVCKHLGRDKCKALPSFHAFTGCDTTSPSLGKVRSLPGWPGILILRPLRPFFLLAIIHMSRLSFHPHYLSF